MALNEKFIQSLKEPGIYWDGEIPGFGIRVYPNGAKSFILDYRLKGVKKRKVLGKWPATPLKVVREIARQKSTVARAGIDPYKKGGNNTPPFSTVAQEYLDRWARKKNKPKTVHESELRLKAKILPAFGTRQIGDIKRDEIIRFFEMVTRKNGPYEANRCLVLIQKIYECALAWERLPEGSINPAARIDRNQERPRNENLSPDDLSRLLAAIEGEDVYVRVGIRLFLLTGLRKMELLTRRWSDIDRENKILRLSDTKAGRPFYLPLSEQALACFEELPKVSEWIFPSKINGSHLPDFPRKPWARIKKKLGIEITIHGLRHTAASWLAAGGVSLKLIGGLLNQSTASITDRYAHLQAESLRGTADALGEMVSRTMPTKAEKNVPHK